MKTLSYNNLELSFTDRGRLCCLSQNGDRITGNRQDDPYVTLVIDGKEYSDAHGLAFARWQEENGALAVTYTGDGFEVTVHIEKALCGLCLYADITALPGVSLQEVQSVTFPLPAVRYDGLDADLFHAPGQGACYEVTSENIIFSPDATTGDMRGFVTQEDMYSTTPDKGAGLLAVERADKTACVGLTSYCSRENFFPMTRVTDDGIYLMQRDMLVFDLRRFPKMETGRVYVLAGSYRQVLESYQTLLSRVVGLRVPETPGWLRRGAILEVSMAQLGDFDRAIGQLDWLYGIGVRTLYLMHCLCYEDPSIYCTIDYFRIEPRFGGEDAFRRFVTALHAKGMRILMDLVPQGTSAGNALVREHPDWYEKTPDGKMFGSHGWDDTCSLDWANPEVQQFFASVASFYVKNFDVDGYRVDAPHWKEPNRDPQLSYHASYTCFGGVRLTEKVLESIRAIKPDAALLNEVWGAVFQHTTHTVCEYNIHWALYNAALSVWNGSQLQRWLSEYRFTQPQDAPKVVFLETHDTRLLTPPAQRLRGSAVTEALMDLAVFAGCQPMIWYDELERRESYYTGLLALRAELGGALEGWADTEAVTTDQPNVFAAARRGERRLLLLENLGSYPTRTHLSGASAFFGLDPQKSYRAEVIRCAGNIGVSFPSRSFTFTGSDLENQEIILEACRSCWFELREL